MKQISEHSMVDRYLSCSPHICVVGKSHNSGSNGLNSPNLALFHFIRMVAILKGLLLKYSIFSRFKVKEFYFRAIIRLYIIISGKCFKTGHRVSTHASNPVEPR